MLLVCYSSSVALPLAVNLCFGIASPNCSTAPYICVHAVLDVDRRFATIPIARCNTGWLALCSSCVYLPQGGFCVGWPKATMSLSQVRYLFQFTSFGTYRILCGARSLSTRYLLRVALSMRAYMSCRQTSTHFHFTTSDMYHRTSRFGLLRLIAYVCLQLAEAYWLMNREKTSCFIIRAFRSRDSIVVYLRLNHATPALCRTALTFETVLSLSTYTT